MPSLNLGSLDKRLAWFLLDIGVAAGGLHRSQTPSQCFFASAISQKSSRVLSSQA